MAIRANCYQLDFFKCGSAASADAIDSSKGALPACDANVALLFAFGDSASLRTAAGELDLKSRFPNAVICGCTTAGQILGQHVVDGPLVLATLSFDGTKIFAATEHLTENGDSKALGAELASKLPPDGLRHVLILSDGLAVNGSALVEGLMSRLPSGVAVTGGLAGDGPHFEQTFLLFGDKIFDRGVIAVGFYGEQLEVSYGSLGGWDPFGPERVVTKAKANVLYELDGRSALSLYKKYLDHHAANLPASGLLFPLSVRNNNAPEPFVRTILSVNEAEQSMTFAGDIPLGAVARFMKANTGRLVDGAADAAGIAAIGLDNQRPEFALLVSCVGRRLVLKQQTEDELEAVAKSLGGPVQQLGFYSYGEIAPFIKHAPTALHNQTMTVTAFRERSER